MAGPIPVEKANEPAAGKEKGRSTGPDDSKGARLGFRDALRAKDYESGAQLLSPGGGYSEDSRCVDGKDEDGKSICEVAGASIEEREALIDRVQDVLREAVHAKLEAVSTWQSQNWSKFLSRTYPTNYVTMNSDHVKNLSLSAVKAGSSAALSAGVHSWLSISGAAVSGSVGFLVSVIAGLIQMGNDRSRLEAAVQKAAKEVGDRVQETNDMFRGEEAKAKKGWASTEANIRSAILGTETRAQFVAMKLCIEDELRLAHELPTPGDLSLFLNLLESWVLERAGDEESPGNGVMEKSYSDARTTLKEAEDDGRGLSFGLDGDNIVKRDLFLDQARFEWGRIGLDSAAALKQYESLLNGAGDISTEALRAKLDHSEFVFERVADGEAFDSEMHHRNRVMVGGRLMDGRPWRRKLRCQVHLHEADGSVYVDRFKYRVEKTQNEATDLRDWTKSPD